MKCSQTTTSVDPTSPFRIYPAHRNGFWKQGWRYAPVLFIVTILLTSQLADAADYSWNVNGGSTWSTNTNWTPTAPTGGPSAAGIFVLINTNITANGTVTLYNTGNLGTAIKTVGRLDLGDTNGTNPFAIATGTGGGVLNFNGSASNAQFNELSTSLGDTVSAPVTLTTSLDVANASTNTLTFSSGGITAATLGTKTLTTSTGAVTISSVIGKGSGDIALTQNGTGTLSLSGTNTYGGGTNLTSGSITLGKSSVITSGSLESGPIGTGTFHLGSGTNAATLQTDAASSTTRSVANNISIDGDVTFATTSAGGTGRIAFNTLYSGSGTGAIFLTTPNTIALTRTNQLTVNSGVQVDLIGAITGSTYGITKLGTGTMVIGSTSTTVSNLDSTANTFNGLTTVSAGSLVLTKNAGTTAIAGAIRVDGTGTLQLNKNDQISNSSTVTMAGGTLLLNGANTNPGTSEGDATTVGIGALTLAANSTLDMGGGNTSLIHFADSSTVSPAWTTGAVLTIQGYSGQIYDYSTSTYSGTAGDAIYFGNSASGLTATQLGQISFSNPSNLSGSFGAFIDSNGQVFAAVPEPSTYIGGGLILGLAGWSQRKRLGSCWWCKQVEKLDCRI